MYENWIFAIVMDDSDNNASYAYFKQNMQEWYNLKSVFFFINVQRKHNLLFQCQPSHINQGLNISEKWSILFHFYVCVISFMNSNSFPLGVPVKVTNEQEGTSKDSPLDIFSYLNDIG